MPELEIRNYRRPDQGAVVELWRDCGLVVPWNDPEKRRISTASCVSKGISSWSGYLGARLVAMVVARYEGHRGWINYLTVAPDCQKNGFGRRLTDETEARLRRLGCPKINLQVRNSNADAIEFYKRIGFSVDDVVSMGKRLQED